MTINEGEINYAIDQFMHPTVFTGVKPVLLIAEELVTKEKLGQVVEAVWIGVDSDDMFSYISKFAVNGKIILGKYYTKEEMEPFSSRIALPNKKNLHNVVLHKRVLEDIKALKTKRADLLAQVEKDFDNLFELNIKRNEVYFFEKDDADWKEELFSDFNIDLPYKLVSIVHNSSLVEYFLENPKTKKVQKHINLNYFHSYFLGSLAEISGLKLKSESILKSIKHLEDEAKILIKQIDWLSLENPKIQELIIKLPKYPFEEYFNYVKKENVRDLNAEDKFLHALEDIILKHMPDNNNPLGIKYIAIDKLLYLFHAVIPRKEALIALEECDIVYEPPGMVLGFEGRYQVPPKFLVPIAQVAKVYQQFQGFINACRDIANEKRA